MDSRRLGPLAGIVISALSVGCAVRSVHSYLERGVDLGRYQGYVWGPADRSGTGDPRLDNNQIFEDRVRAAVDAQLASRGFEKAASASPQLLIQYHVKVEQQIDRVDQPRSASCQDCRPFVYDAGTLMIDLVDARTNSLLWRGWVEANVDGVVGNQHWMEAQIDEAVARIFDRLPRRNR